MSIESREIERIAFLLERDNLSSVVIFCDKTIKAYRRALKAAEDGINAYGRVYKAELLGSIAVLESFILDCLADGIENGSN